MEELINHWIENYDEFKWISIQLTKNQDHLNRIINGKNEWIKWYNILFKTNLNIKSLNYTNYLETINFIENVQNRTKQSKSNSNTKTRSIESIDQQIPVNKKQTRKPRTNSSEK